MATRLVAVQEARLKKLEALKKLGIDPYPSRGKRTHTAGETSALRDGQVTVVGRIWAIRTHGGATFIDLHDSSGKIQLYFQEDKLGKEEYAKLDLLDMGDFLEASGEVFKTQKGEPTVKVSKWQILTKSLRPLPSTWHGLKDVEERYRQRYVDFLLNPKAKENLLLRARFIDLLRGYLKKNSFVEIDTPILQPIYGGAAARPFVTHHNALDADLYLRISDELYLKRLIVGGFEKVFEIGRDFRNEGLEKGRNPEFTQLEFYWAYADYEDLMEFTEKMLVSILKELKGSTKFKYGEHELDFTPPIKRVSYKELIKKEAGIDIDKVKTEKELLAEIKKKGVQLDLHGIAGYGGVLDALYKRVVRPGIVGPIFLVDHPLEMFPLAKQKGDELSKVATFQLVAVGEEFIKAYNELNDPIDQRERWNEETRLAKRGFEEHQVLDEDYIRALEYGMPPTAGWGLGVDRFVMLLTDSANIKEVIAFPTLRPEKRK
ncbi:MAG: lysine--tRNA ligase [bacterium]|nr:lysine--tRNA ligase [bacterium]